MRVVVTGAGGFIGSHLVEALVRRGDVVDPWVRGARRGLLEIPVETVAVDITDSNAVFGRLEKFAPELIFHLAGQSLPGRSWDDPVLTYQVNVIGTIQLLQAVRMLPRPPRVLVAGSSAEYDDSRGDTPIAEATPTRPNSPYGASKLAANNLVELYYRRYGLDLVRFRPFFIAGPRKTGDVCSDFARRIVAIERGGENMLRVGSLEVVRDVLDIRDGISGILRIADAGAPGELYNVCSGRGVRIGDILDIYCRLSKMLLKATPDPALVRSLEQKVRIGDASRLRALGWQPRFELVETLTSILDYWRRAPS